MNNLIPISALCRQMIRLTRGSLGAVEFVPSPESGWLGAYKGCDQKYVEFMLDPEDLLLSLEDFSDNFLVAGAGVFASELKHKDIGFSYDLWLPDGKVAARHVFDGLSMRAVLTPLVMPERIEALAGEKVGAYSLRFDVLYSSERIDLTREMPSATAA
jgi:hypothetical protein